ncbi:MAG: DUF5331 domain-containing protein [Trichodesmium sp. MAG_R03]|nr:DUF5331 domain-containing protein [Trichodesmium sp. MAG_R03]
MVFFKELLTSLKQKWLEYYQKNHPWLILHMTEQNTIQTPDGGRRPLSYLILGILNALEPELEALMFPFSKLKADADSLVEVLGLNFDPDIAIGEKPGFSLEKSTPVDIDDQTGADAQELPGGNQPVIPDTIEDSNDLATIAATAIIEAATLAKGVELAAGLDQDLDDLPDNDQGKSNLELENDDNLAIELDSDSKANDGLGLEMELVADELDMGLDSDSQADDELDLGLDSDSQADDDLDLGLDSDSQADDDLDLGLDSDSQADDELDLGLDSDSQADDELDLGLDSDSQANDDLASIDLGELDENSSDFMGEDLPESFEDISTKLDESELDELDDNVNLFAQDSLNEIADIDLSELAEDPDLDCDLDGEDLNLDEADLDSLVGDKKSSNHDLEGFLG